MGGLVAVPHDWGFAHVCAHILNLPLDELALLAHLALGVVILGTLTHVPTDFFNKLPYKPHSFLL